jgi:hypothetical protein
MADHVALTSVVYPHYFDADPDSDFLFDPDPIFDPDVDPDPDPQILASKKGPNS